MYNNLSLIKPRPGIRYNRAHPLAQGLVAYWLFNEGSGTVTTDVNGKPGTLNNFTTAGWTGSINGGGLRFDGTDDYVNIGTVLQKYVDYNKPFSIAMWFTFHTYSSTVYHELLGHLVQRGTAYAGVEIRIDPNDVWEVYFVQAPAINTQNGFYWRWVSKVAAPEVGKQYMIVFNYDGGNASSSGIIYMNGVNWGSEIWSDYGAITSSIYDSGYLLDKDLWIGRRNFSTGDMPFAGIIDALRVYNRVLHTDEIKTLYTQPHIDFHGSKTKLLAGAI